MSDLENAKIVATDISENALKVAKQNFESLAPNAKIDFIKRWILYQHQK